MSDAASINAPDRPSWGRGLLGDGLVTPERRASAIEWGRVVFAWRDVVSIIGIVWLLWLIKSDLRDLNTKFDAYQTQQAKELVYLQNQILEWRGETKLVRERDTDRQKEIAEIKGMLIGLGISKDQRK